MFASLLCYPLKTICCSSIFGPIS